MEKYALCTFHKCASNWFRDIFWLVAEDNYISVQPHPESESRFGKMVERGPYFLWIFATGNYQDFEKTFGKQESQIIPCVLAVRSSQSGSKERITEIRSRHSFDVAKTYDEIRGDPVVIGKRK